MIQSEKVKIKPLILRKLKNGKLKIVDGYHTANILKFIGIEELTPQMYQFSNGCECSETLKLSEIEVVEIQNFEEVEK